MSTIIDPPDAPLTQTALNERCNQRIRQLLDTEPLPVSVEPQNDKIARFLSYMLYQQIFFGCLGGCERVLNDAYSYCADCVVLL